MIYKESEVQNLQNRVVELEWQLQGARSTIRRLRKRKRTEEPRLEKTRLLDLAEAGLTKVLENLPVGIWIVDDRGRLICKNKQADRIGADEVPLGASIEEYRQYPAWYPESGKGLQSEEYPIARVLRTGKPAGPVELKIRRSNGSQGTILASAVPIKDRLGRFMGVIEVNVDITKRKQAEEVLRESEERFAKAFHASSSALVVSRQEDGQIETVNDTFIKFFGYSREEVIGRTSTELGMFLNPEDRVEAVRRLQNGGSVRDFELDVRLKSGEVRNVSLSIETLNIGGHRMMLTAIQDIAIRKRTEDALRASEERYRAVFENAIDAIVVADPSRNGKVVSVNPAACHMFGYSAKEFLRLDRKALLDTEDPRLVVFLEQRQHHGQITGQLTYKRKDGTLFPGEISSTVYQDKNGEPRALAIIRDITDREQAGEALRESEERFAKAFHVTPSAITISRLSDGLILEVNEGWRTVLGHTPSEVLGRTTLELDIYVNPQAREQAIHRLKRDGFLRDFEIEVRHKSGETRQMSMSAERMDIEGVECLLTVMQDITERKKFEIALRKRESILAQAGEMAHLGAWDIEFHNQDDVNANPLSWSDEVYRIFGYVPGEVKPSNELFFERVHPDDRALVQESVARAIATRQPYRIEHRVRRPDGEERIVQEHGEVFFDEAGKPLRIVGAVQDITERKHAEEALRQSEERFRSLADSMPQLVWTALPDGTVDYYNQRYHEYWGIKQIEGSRWDWSPILYPEDLETTVNVWQHSVETGEIYQIEHRVRMADGSYRWHLSRGVPMLDEKGRIIRWFGTATDIHDLKLAEEQSKVYAERLEHSNRELEQFAFMASHDLQEPLRKIEVFGDMLLESSRSLNGRERNYLDRMRDAAGRMRDMVEGLLQLSRVTTQGKPFTQVDLSQATADVLSDLENTIRRVSGKVEVETLPVVEGDPLQLRQLMQNLIGNALKYHPPEVPPEVKVYAKQLWEKVQIFVEDKGIGFEQEDAERIFQPFQRLVGRSQYEGSGMGLAICRRIVERHGGEITALGKPGQGTTFIVTLPVYHLKSNRNELRKDANGEDSGITSDR